MVKHYILGLLLRDPAALAVPLTYGLPWGFLILADLMSKTQLILGLSCCCKASYPGGLTSSVFLIEISTMPIVLGKSPW